MEALEQIWIRMRFRRFGGLSYLAHLDLMRLMERALRRAKAPLYYTQGFNPRPQLVFALPMGLGLDCEGDLLDIRLEARVSAESLKERLNMVLPKGLEMVFAEDLTDYKTSAMALVEGARYRYALEGLGSKVAPHLGQEGPYKVMRFHKGKQKEIDIYPLIWKLSAPDADSLLLEAAAGSKENLRPELLLQHFVNLEVLTEDEADDCAICRECLFLRG